MSLAALLQSPGCSLAEVQALLSATDHAGRVAATRGCNLAELTRLWALAAEAPPLDAEHFVGHRGPLEPVAHDGWNSLPLPASARRFQKVFCRAPGRDDVLYGYNEGDAKGTIGPGYFQLVPTGSTPGWAERGAWVVDYYQVPPVDAVPEGWPKVVPNWWGLQLFVYNGTRDFMRRVSEHVCIGKPWARGLPLPFCFVLVRAD